MADEPGRDAHLRERTTASTMLLEGSFLRVRRDTVALPDGGQAQREYVVHPGAVMVVPLQDDGRLDGEAVIYRLPGAQGELGFISSVTLPFCASCSRARLTADGRLRLCLLREKEVDLLTPLRQGASLEELRQLILEGIWHKPWGHGLADGEVALNRGMSEIGG